MLCVKRVQLKYLNGTRPLAAHINTEFTKWIPSGNMKLGDISLHALSGATRSQVPIKKKNTMHVEKYEHRL